MCTIDVIVVFILHTVTLHKVTYLAVLEIVTMPLHSIVTFNSLILTTALELPVNDYCDC